MALQGAHQSAQKSRNIGLLTFTAAELPSSTVEYQWRSAALVEAARIRKTINSMNTKFQADRVCINALIWKIHPLPLEEGAKREPDRAKPQGMVKVSGSA